ncbi:MAG: hypothetical protein V4572_01085 [Bacteroidota bacterium]
MRKTIVAIVITLFLITANAFSQTKLKRYKVGHNFFLKLPSYMSKTVDLNDLASFQFQNKLMNVGGFIQEYDKEQLRLAKIDCNTINNYFEIFIKDAFKGQPDRQPEFKKIGENNFIEYDVSYSGTNNTDLYYFIGIVESPTTYYTIICISNLVNKDRFKPDFQKILYSFRE